jgi:drug/metabolite transporter (DMT)-like permease
MKKDKGIPVYFYALAAMLFWGMSFVWSSILLTSYKPVTIIFIRLVISSCFLFLLVLVLKIKVNFQKKDLRLLFFSALFNPFLYFLGENYGLKYTTSTITSIIIATIPLFTPVAAWFVFRERLSWLNMAGIFISFTGVLLMLLKNDLSLVVDPKGIIFLSGAVLSAIVYTVLLKKLAVRYSPLLLIASQNLIGVFLFLPIFLYFDASQFVNVAPTARIVTSFLFLSILASSLSYVFFAKTVKMVGISKANVFTNLIPVFTAVFSYFILNEYFTVLKITGILIVITGVYISEINNKKSMIK